jgi:hypothetical protein
METTDMLDKTNSTTLPAHRAKGRPAPRTINDGAALREARTGRNAGVEPMAAKDEAKRALDGRLTISALIDLYAAGPALALKNGAETLRLLSKHVAPALGAMAVTDVTGGDVERLLIDEKTHIANADAARIGGKMLVLPNDGMKFLETLPDGPLAKPAHLKRKD